VSEREQQPSEGEQTEREEQAEDLEMPEDEAQEVAGGWGRIWGRIHKQKSEE
jgi:hypothetical protein